MTLEKAAELATLNAVRSSHALTWMCQLRPLDKQGFCALSGLPWRLGYSGDIHPANGPSLRHPTAFAAMAGLVHAPAPVLPQVDFPLHSSREITLVEPSGRVAVWLLEEETVPIVPLWGKVEQMAFPGPPKSVKIELFV